MVVVVGMVGMLARQMDIRATRQLLTLDPVAKGFMARMLSNTREGSRVVFGVDRNAVTLCEGSR